MNGFGVRDLREQRAGYARHADDDRLGQQVVHEHDGRHAEVDAGWLSWDTPMVDLLPEFAVSDPSLTPKLTVADAFCACTGLPRHDAELIFNFDSITPERDDRVDRQLPLTTPFGQEFQYSNQMYAIGGYAAAVAAGANPADLYSGYRSSCRIGSEPDGHDPLDLLA